MFTLFIIIIVALCACAVLPIIFGALAIILQVIGAIIGYILAYIIIFIGKIYKYLMPKLKKKLKEFVIKICDKYDNR